MKANSKLNVRSLVILIALSFAQTALPIEADHGTGSDSNNDSSPAAAGAVRATAAGETKLGDLGMNFGGLGETAKTCPRPRSATNLPHS